MLDTNICSFIMRKRPRDLLERLQHHVTRRDSIVVSAITYAELRFGAIGKKAAANHGVLVDAFVERVDRILPWDSAAVDATTRIKQELAARGTPIGANDAAIAGNAIAADCVLVTNNRREFDRVPQLSVEDWTRGER